MTGIREIRRTVPGIGSQLGLTASQLNAGMDPELLAAIAAFLLLVIFTGYLIIL